MSIAARPALPVVSKSGIEFIIHGGTTSFTTVSSGGFQRVSSGGAAISTTVSSGGTQFVFSSGTAIDTTSAELVVRRHHGQQRPGRSPGGSAVSTTVSRGGFEFVSSGGVVSFTTVRNGGEEDIEGTASNTTVSSGGEQFVDFKGTASVTTVGTGGTQFVEFDGTAIGTTVNSGAAEFVLSNGTTSFTVVSKGAAEFLFPGGTASDTTVSTGGYLIVASGGNQNGTMLSGGQIVSTGVVTYAPGALWTAMSSATSPSAGRAEFILASGTARTVYRRHRVRLLRRHRQRHLGQPRRRRGRVFRWFDQLHHGDKPGPGGRRRRYDFQHDGVRRRLRVVVAGGIASFTTVNSGGDEFAYSGGTARSTTVSSGGAEFLYSGGTASFTTVSSGGDQFVYSSGTASGTTVSSGGDQFVYSSGTAIGTTVSSGGTEIVSSGGSASDTDIHIGGSIDVTSLAFATGGTASVSSTTDILTVSVGGHSYTQQLAGDYTATESFQLAPDTGSGTLVTLEGTPCYCRGTLLLTANGDVAVEELQVGDRLKCDAVRLGAASAALDRACGTLEDLRRHTTVPNWCNRGYAYVPMHSPTSCRAARPAGLPGPRRAARRRVGRGKAAGERRQHPARYFTLLSQRYHVELETHDILLAELRQLESCLDTGNRRMFENADEPLTLHPDFDTGQQRRVAASCRPFVDDAASVEPIWHRLAMRAAMLGLALPAAIEITRDPGLHVVVDGAA